MKKDTDKTKEQLIAELAELRKKSEKREEEQKAANQQLDANNQQLIASEQELKKEKIFSEKIVETADAIIVGLDKDHIIRIFNRGAEQIIGYKKEEVIGKDWFKLVFPKGTPDEMDKVWKDAWGVKSHSNINPIFVKSGEERIISWQTSGMYDSDDVSKHLLLSIGEDITQRKQAEETLKMERDKLNSIFEAMDDGIYIVDKEYDIQYANPVIKKEFGPTAGIKCYKYFHDSDKPCTFCKNEDVFAGKSVKWEWTSPRNGKTYDLFDTPLKNPDGSISKLEIFRDITKRKQAEEKFKESEVRFKSLYESMEEGVCLHEVVYDENEKAVDYKIIDINPKYEDILGIKSADAVNSLASETYNSDKPPYLDKYSKVAETGDPIDFETYFPPMDKYFYISVFSPKKGQFATVFSDITKRKQAEEKLKESKEKYKSLILNSPDMMMSQKVNGEITFVSPQCEKILGFTIEEIMSMDTQKQIHPDDVEIAVENSLKTLKGTDLNNFQYRFFNKNGDIVWLNHTARSIIVDGEIKEVFSTVRDITERKKAEEKLKESEQKLNSILNNMADVVWSISWPDLRHEYLSPSVKKLYGISEQEFMDNPTLFKEVTHPDDRYLTEKAMKQLVEEGEAERECRIIKPDGSIVWINDRSKMIYDENHQPIKVEGVTRDITERKQTEENLKLAKENAEESDHLKTAFLNNMSHEIRTPLNGITGFIELLKEPEIDDEEKQHYFDIISKSSARLITTVTDIMDISRIESGELKVTKTELSVNEILEEQFDFFQREAKSKGLELNYKPSLTDSESRIITDRHKFESVLINLIKNAVKYTETGEITLGCGLKENEDGKFIEFYVKDTGIGVPADRVEAIFNRFEQADISDTRAFEGSGLGLAISKSYVEMLGGVIGVSSKEGSGSTFTFSIPYEKKNSKKKSSKKNNEEETGVSLKNLSIIVAEDDEMSRLFLETILKNRVKHITYTTNGKETIEKLRENPDTDVILMDIKMPDMNGHDASREIRKFNSEVIIIAQTAYGLMGDREKAIEAGCNDYISKPINKTELHAMIQKHFVK